MLFASVGTGEIVLILVAIAMLWALGRYGRDTRIGCYNKVHSLCRIQD